MTATRKSSFSVQRSAFSVSTSAFTLIEIMVVVAIIIVLMAILLPALSAAKASARKTETRALLGSLSTDIESYYTVFNAYPGPATPAQTSVASANKLTGTQNLLLGLSYSLNATVTAATPSAIQVLPTVLNSPPSSPTVSGYADPTAPTGPTDFSSTNPTTPVTYKSCSAFYVPAAKELSPYAKITAPGSPPNPPTYAWNPAGVTTNPVVTCIAFPTILDRYPDALPILYYRKTPGVDGTAKFDATGNITGVQGTPPIVSLNSSVTASYYVGDNIEYTNGAITSLSGVVFDQSIPSPNPNLNHVYPLNSTNGNDPANNLATEIAANNNTNATSHGGYVLISAGPDRLYGGGNKTDDLIQVGGQ